MKWRKIGKIFEPLNNATWMFSHASVPCADRLKDDLYRIYFSTRDKKNRSSTAFIEIDVKNPTEILHIAKQPVLTPGDLGTFDDNGAMESCLVENNGKKFLYYVGWNKGATVRYHTSIGLAISSDSGRTFHKYSKGPILERSVLEPHFCSNPYVIIENGKWRMWYISIVKWELRDNEPFPYYHIKYAESDDGLAWKRSGTVCIDFKDDKEWAISRPCVLNENGLYKMWYSYRGKKSYRIGYAESNNGINWNRKDKQVGIDVSHSGWDSEMIEYPFVFNHGGKKYMLYCGNEFGKTGFGISILENI